MLKNYPGTYLFLLAVLFLIFLTAITPLVGNWHILCASVMKVLTFTTKIICGILLFAVVIDATNAISYFKKHRHF